MAFKCGMLFACLIAAAPLLAAPLAIGTEEVHFSSEPGVVIAGSIELPNSSRPVPAVIIVLGTGPWTRGGFADIRARLHAHGIATLIYDKRGQGHSTGAFVDTLPAMERDVAAAVAFLRTRQDIDPRRIALLGHSQGAVAAPAIASRDPGIAAVAALSGPVGSRGDNFVTIMRSNLTAGGRSAIEEDRIIAATTAWMEARSRGADAAAVAQLRSAEVAGFASNGFTRAQAEQFTATLDTPVVLSMYEADSAKPLSLIRVPVLMVYGTNDVIIAPAASIGAAQAALARNVDALVVAVPGVDHGLATPAGAARAAHGDYSIDPTVPAVTRLVGDWLIDRLSGAD